MKKRPGLKEDGVLFGEVKTSKLFFASSQVGKTSKTFSRLLM